MAYILRTHIKKKRLVVGLSSVFGIGSSLSKKVCRNLGFQTPFLLKNLTDEDIYMISLFVDDLSVLIKGDLKRWLKYKIENLISLNTYRGFRLRQGLPLRGQRTHTNARTAKRLIVKRKKS